MKNTQPVTRWFIRKNASGFPVGKWYVGTEAEAEAEARRYASSNAVGTFIENATGDVFRYIAL